MPIDWQVYLNSVIGALLAFAATWFWWAKNQLAIRNQSELDAANERARVLAVAHEAVLARVTELETKERVASQQFSPIITAFQAILVKQLTHPNKDEMDELLIKVGPPHTLTPDESARLAVMLKERSHDIGGEVTLSEREAAIIMPIVMRMASEEQTNITAAHDTDPSNLKMITVVSVVTDGKTAVETKP